MIPPAQLPGICQGVKDIGATNYPDAVALWDQTGNFIGEPYYPKAGKGRPPIGLQPDDLQPGSSLPTLNAPSILCCY